MQPNPPGRPVALVLSVATALTVALTVVPLLVVGHRAVTRPSTGGGFDFVIADAEGLRIFGHGATLPRPRFGWHACFARLEADLERAGDTLTMTLTDHPVARLGECREGTGSNDAQFDDGILVDAPGPPPRTVRVAGSPTVHRVVDTEGGPIVAGATSDPVDYGSFQGDEVHRLMRSWSLPDGPQLRLTYPVPLVGADPDAWLRSGDLGRLSDRGIAAHRVAPDVAFRVDGVRLRARQVGSPGGGISWLVVSAPDGRVVLEINAESPTRAQVRDVLGRLRVRS